MKNEMMKIQHNSLYTLTKLNSGSVKKDKKLGKAH